MTGRRPARYSYKVNTHGGDEFVRASNVSESLMLRTLKISSGRLADCDVSEGQVLVYISPDETERRYLIDTLKLDEHTLTSALDPDEQSRLEFEPEHVAVIFKQPKNYSSEDNYVFRVTSTGLFLFKDRLVIVAADDLPLFDGRPFTRLLSLPELMLKIIYRSVFHFVGHLKTINMISSELEQQINTSMENKHLFSLFTLEKSLVFYLNAINANAKMTERIKNNAAKIGFSAENMELLDDLIIENTQCYDQANIYSNILSSLMDARASIVSNNLNMLMKKLTIITIAIMVPTFVVSAFSMNIGMNARIPLADHPQAFWLIMALAASAVAGLLLYARYKRW